MGYVWPGLRKEPEWALILRIGRAGEVGLLWVFLGLTVIGSGPREAGCQEVGVICAGPLVVVRGSQEEGYYEAELEGQFSLRVSAEDPFRVRLLVLFLRQLEVEGEVRGSRRTRDGRTPFVRQQYLAKALGIVQPDLSRWERYWQKGDWRRLLSQHTREILTLELQQRIIETWARWPGWGVRKILGLLRAQGIEVTEGQVRQAAHESGWETVRQELAKLCVRRGEELRLREDWLVGDLLRQVASLLEKVENGQSLVREEIWDLQTWRAATAEMGMQARAPEPAQSWLRRLEQTLFQPWQEVSAGEVRCPRCGGERVGRKGLKPRMRTFVDDQGQVCQIGVFRYRCYNPACVKKSFTVLPPGLLPYSRHSAEAHVLALQMYAWARSTYRLTGKALGVASTTAYRWVSAFGHECLPVAALFGLVKQSGVVGVDEKWVQVPKNNKPAGEHRKWMYVYMAVDVYTYDLLHIAIYPYNNQQSAQAFLLALRAKGYHPQVVVTDLRRDYGPVLASVFPQAQHHECLFHASQALHRHLAQAYGWDALRRDPQVQALCQALDRPLQATTKVAAQQHYDRIMTQRAAWVKEKPQLDAAFAMLEAHWPKLINGIESHCIPPTNNTVELVIRRFDQHYQNFCGFDSLQSAQRFLAVFEKVYRFTPFSDDAQPRIRGKSPLQLAGYDVAQIPMTALCNGWALTQPSSEAVPNV